MEYRKLGRSDVEVSALCLGTMTFGQQNSETDAHSQLDLALERGVNFIDTAEMYPVPTKAETQGRTETFIGSWFAGGAPRDKVVLATKVSGYSDNITWIRDGKLRLDRPNIETALDDSLRRLQTDYIDLYQVHWPDRVTNYFGQLGYRHQEREAAVPIAETLAVLGDLVTAGKVRQIGVSNETPWGVMTWLSEAERAGLPRVVSIQNPYNLLNRSFEVGLAEVAHREQVGLLAYSPLAFGTLTGKYLGGDVPKNSRLDLFRQYQRYTKPRGVAATERYVTIAREYGLDAGQMALAYVTSRAFLTSAIIGATSLAQLESNLGSAGLALSEQVLAAIEAVHQENPNPCP